MQGISRNAPADSLRAKLDAVGWGAFFIWIGVAFIADVGWSAGLFGIGVIMLAVQAARRYFGLPVEYFWLIMGAVLVVWGAWDLLGLGAAEFAIPGGLIPLVFIGFGIAIVVSAFLRKPPR